jgi:hypothetical protein
MTGIEIKRAAENYVDEFIDDPEAVTAINRALNIIGDTALIYEQAHAYIPKADEWYELPPTATNIREVEDANGKSYEHFRTRDNMIAFDHPGEYTVHYRRLPKPISGILDVPEVHPAFHQVLVTYVIAWWKLKDDDTNPDGVRHMQMFREDTMRVFNILRRTRGPKSIRVER